MRYELMDLQTGNVVRFYRSQTAALRDVAETIDRLGPQAVADLALGESAHPPGGAVLAGQALVERALARGSSRSGLPARTPGAIDGAATRRG